MSLKLKGLHHKWYALNFALAYKPNTSRFFPQLQYAHTHTHTHTDRTACAQQQFRNVALLNVTFSLLYLFPFFSSHLVTTIHCKYTHCTINNRNYNLRQKRNSCFVTFAIHPDSHLLLLGSTHLFHKDGSTEDRSLKFTMLLRYYANHFPFYIYTLPNEPYKTDSFVCD